MSRAERESTWQLDAALSHGKRQRRDVNPLGDQIPYLYKPITKMTPLERAHVWANISDRTGAPWADCVDLALALGVVDRDQLAAWEKKQ